MTEFPDVVAIQVDRFLAAADKHYAEDEAFDEWCDSEGRDGTDEDREDFDAEVEAAREDAAVEAHLSRLEDEDRWRDYD